MELKPKGSYDFKANNSLEKPGNKEEFKLMKTSLTAWYCEDIKIIGVSIEII